MVDASHRSKAVFRVADRSDSIMLQISSLVKDPTPQDAALGVPAQ
jgi:hypothetical protein